MAKARRHISTKSGSFLNIPEKANRILHIILIALVLIAIRIWHLTVIQYEERSEEASRPRSKTVIEPAPRGTIRDRFNIPLAFNKIKYQAAIHYANLREIPRIDWRLDEQGKKIRYFKRREYITQLSQLLAKELHLDAERLEDLIYSKAAYFYNIPFIIKEEIGEQEYYRLKMLEKDWPGIAVSITPKRVYPQDKVGAEIIGYMGSINHSEHEALIHKLRTYETFVREYEAGNNPELPAGAASLEEVEEKLQSLQDQAYTATDYIGKSGIEGAFESVLRGFYGKKKYYSDAKGNFLRELEGSKNPQSGQRILLTISSELQEHAEKVLAANEKLREERNLGISSKEQNHCRYSWMKGGAIVAMDPNNGEVLAMASYPRFDPNDFILTGNAEQDKLKNARIRQWFENEAYIGEIWDLKRPLEREIYNPQKKQYQTETLELSWKVYLDFILPKQHPVQQLFSKYNKIENVVEVQQAFQEIKELLPVEKELDVINLLYSSEDGHKVWQDKLSSKQKEAFRQPLQSIQELPAKEVLDSYLASLPHNYDKGLFIDLCRTVVSGNSYSPRLLLETGRQSIEDYRKACGAFAALHQAAKKMAREIFHETNFKQWRLENEKAFLKEKRVQEKAQGLYPKAYIDYLDKEEEAQFTAFWQTNSWPLLCIFLTGQEFDQAATIEDYLNFFAQWHWELAQGAHPTIEWRLSYETLSGILAKFSPQNALSYLQTLRSYEQLDGKLINRYRYLRSSNGVQLEKHLASAFYPLYGYGYARSYAFRQSTTQGSIFKLVVAYEALIQRYEKLLAEGRSLLELNPLEIIDRECKQGKQWAVGFMMDGQPISRMYKGGRVPKSLTREIGRMDLVRALEFSSNPYFALLAGDHLEDPLDLLSCAKQFGYGSKTGIELSGEIAGKLPDDIDRNRTNLYAFAIGQAAFIATPLQTAGMVSSIANGGALYQPKVVSLLVKSQQQENGCETATIESFPPTLRWLVPMPDPVRNMILKGMQRVVARTQEEGLRGLARFYSAQPEALRSYLEMRDWLAGKSSSAETVEHLSMDIENGLVKSTHGWFGAILFNNPVNPLLTNVTVARDLYGKPELVVIVYLRFSAHGKDAAPLAAQVAQKWREIKAKQGLMAN